MRARKCIAMILSTATAFVGCGGDDEACVPEETLPTCAALYAPTFAEIHARTLARSCAIDGPSCHSAEGARGGLILETAEAAYAGLVESGRVQPGAPGCSELVARIDAVRASIVMPPGRPLSEPERCAIRLWIANGAKW